MFQVNLSKELELLDLRKRGARGEDGFEYVVRCYRSLSAYLYDSLYTTDHASILAYSHPLINNISTKQVNGFQSMFV